MIVNAGFSAPDELWGALETKTRSQGKIAGLLDSGIKPEILKMFAAEVLFFIKIRFFLFLWIEKNKIEG